MASEFIRTLANHHSNAAGTTKEKQSNLEQIYFTICKWLNENLYSPFVLLFSTISTTSLETMPTHFQRQFGLGIVECCIAAYFESKPENKIYELLIILQEEASPKNGLKFLNGFEFRKTLKNNNCSPFQSIN